MEEATEPNTSEEVADQPRIPSLDELPDIVIEKILEYLPAGDLFNAMSTSPRLMGIGLPLIPEWLDFAEHFRNVSEEDVEDMLEKFGAHVRKVRLRSRQHVGIRQVLKFCPNVVGLALNSNFADIDHDLPMVFRRFPQLQELRLFYCLKGCVGPSFNSCSFADVPTGMKAIVIDFDYERHDAAIESIANRCQNLERFQAMFLRGRVRLPGDRLPRVAESLVVLLKSCPNLKEFRFGGDVEPSTTLSVNPLRFLGENLTVLGTCASGCVTDEVIRQVVHSCPNLQIVQFEGETSGDNFTSSGLRQLASLEHLTSLSLRRCDIQLRHAEFFEDLSAIFAKGKLTHLDVSRSTSFPGRRLLELMVKGNYLALRSLDCHVKSIDRHPLFGRTYLLDPGTVEAILEHRLRMAEQGKKHPIRIDASGTRAFRTPRINELLMNLEKVGCHCEFLPGA